VNLFVSYVGWKFNLVDITKEEVKKDLSYSVHIGTEKGVEMILDVFIAYKHKL